MPSEYAAARGVLQDGSRKPASSGLFVSQADRLRILAAVAVQWAFLVTAHFLLRPPAPIDETRILAVAWEMWSRGDWLVPYLNGQPYSHKPPLLQWLILSGWTVFGVNELWARLLPGLFGLGTLLVIAAIARKLWPNDSVAAVLAPLLAGATCLISAFHGMLYYDMPLTFLAVLGAWGTVTAALGSRRLGFGLLALAIGLGLITKGPAIFLHTLFVAILAPLWAPPGALESRKRWYLGVLACCLAGIAIALAWAIPAAMHGGEAYARELLWGQTAERLTDSFAHKRPVWFYFAMLPLLLLPWSIWPRAWQGIFGHRWRDADPGVRFGGVWFAGALVAFSLVSGKQVQYLMPSLPGILLVLAHGLARKRNGLPSRWDAIVPFLLLVVPGFAIAALPFVARLHELPYPLDGAWTWPGWLMLIAGVVAWRFLHGDIVKRCLVVSVSTAFAIILAATALMPGMRAGYRLEPIGAQLAELQRAGVPIAHVGKYHGQYQYAGRLAAPLEVIDEAHAEAWLQAHPNGALVGYVQEWQPAASVASPVFSQPFRNKQVVIWRRD